MNKLRRAELEKLQSRIDQVREDLETLLDEEQEYYDNMPFSLQSGEKGDKAQEAVDYMQSAMDSMDEAASAVEEARQ